uniref:Uncharacterized protein n=1 Tax=Drosophila melanogaster TaxID=7227 RepID=Q4ABJ8_DROME|nr:uncharacterized protein Dmel_CG33647 [Drosophila melanogaster]AAZ66057.1 uncharacterized protein Dmel_CG33647 [Drosophila melanogaster]|eukprot:NP_001027136.1 uncharacterized protein Dmel_CG33647 [Drosophila melanogaster]
MNVKKLFILVDLILGTLILSSVRAEKEVFMTKIECLNYMPELVRNVSCYLNETSHPTGSIYAEFILTQDVEDLKGIYILTFKRGSYVTNFTSSHVDYCQMLSSVENHFLFRMVTTQLRETANFPIQCPLKMNKRYYAKGFTVNSKFIPSYMPETNFISDAHLSVKDRKVFRLLIKGRFSRILRRNYIKTE